MGETLITTSY